MSEHAVMPLADYVGICDAVRAATGETETIKSGEMANQIERVRGCGFASGQAEGYERGYNAALSEGTSDATASANDILAAKTAYVKGEKIEGACRYREYTAEVETDVVGSRAYAVLAKDDLLAQHRTDENLIVEIRFNDLEQIARTFIYSLSFNKEDAFGVYGSSEVRQYLFRYGTSANFEFGVRATPLYADSEDEITGVYSALITADGELRLYSFSTSYAVRAGTYTVYVHW